jgi:CRP-like cAMP-binding protein
VILDGEAAVVVDGTERARLGRGEFFGEISIILGERRSPTSSPSSR